MTHRAIREAMKDAIRSLPPMHVTNTDYVPQAKRRPDAVIDRAAAILAIEHATLPAAAPDPVASPRKWDYNAPHPFESKDLGNPTYDFCICERRRTDAMHLPDPVASPAGTRLILTDDVFLEEWRIRTDDGYRITAEWGDPDEHGWYEPTFTVDYSDRIAGAVASPAPLDVLRLARAIEQHRTGRWYDPTLKSDFEEAEGIAAEYARLEGQPVAEEPTDAP